MNEYYRTEAVEIMSREVAGNWSTVREDLADDIKEAFDANIEYDAYSIEGGDGDMWLCFELDDEDYEIRFRIDKAGSTWYISRVE